MRRIFLYIGILLVILILAAALINYLRVPLQGVQDAQEVVVVGCELRGGTCREACEPPEEPYAFGSCGSGDECCVSHQELHS